MSLSLRTIFLVIVFKCSISSLNAQGADTILFWSKDHRLNFADFQGKQRKEDTTLIAATSNMATHTLGSIVKSIDVHVKTEKTKIIFTIYAGMKRNLSWLKNNGDSITLKHEQGHFDICEIYARMLRRDLQKAKSMDEARKLFDKIMELEETEHDLYDRENTFDSGGITEIWKEKIADRLKELEAYSNPVVKIYNQQ